MSEQTKVLINLREGIIELEGSEAFVSKYLDEFKEGLFTPLENEESTEQDVEDATSEKGNEKSNGKPSKNKKIRIPERIEAEKFDLTGNKEKGTLSLQEFLDQKKPGRNTPNIILAVGYYITNVLGNPEFSEGNIEFAYRALTLPGKPLYLHQSHVDLKNKKVWLESGSTSQRWKISPIGQHEIEQKMPYEDKKE